jgi:predicted metalloprotease
MQWEDKRRSNNVDDRRGMSKGKIAAGGGIGVIIIALLSLFTGKDLSFLNDVVGNQNSIEQTERLSEAELANRSDARAADFVKVVLASTEDVWTEIFRQNNLTYKTPKLTLFDDVTQTGCGVGQAGMGPFYCPVDQHAYIDLSFCDELKNKFNAPGDFAVAYVIAHEIGHHIQNLQGRTAWMQQQRGKISEAAYNRLSVQLELQADFYAGIWAHYSQKQFNWLVKSDIESALKAAEAIGDDKLQKEAQGYVVPESFTHGTSQQRMTWFMKGFETGDLNQGKYENIR